MSGVARNPVRSAQWRVPDSYYLRACQRGIGSFGYRESANKLTWALPAPRRVAVEPGTRELPASSVRSLGLMLLAFRRLIGCHHGIRGSLDTAHQSAEIEAVRMGDLAPPYPLLPILRDHRRRLGQANP